MAKPKKSPLATGPQSQKKEYDHLPLRLRILKRKNQPSYLVTLSAKEASHSTTVSEKKFQYQS